MKFWCNRFLQPKKMAKRHLLIVKLFVNVSKTYISCNKNFDGYKIFILDKVSNFQNIINLLFAEFLFFYFSASTLEDLSAILMKKINI